MDGMTAVYAFISFEVCIVLLALVLVWQANRQSKLMHQLIEAYGDTLTQVAKDALIQSKAQSAEDAVRALSSAAYERESLKQQVEDHKAWRNQVIHVNANVTPIDQNVDDGIVVMDDGEEYLVKEKDGHKILVNKSSGEEFDVLAGA